MMSPLTRVVIASGAVALVVANALEKSSRADAEPASSVPPAQVSNHIGETELLTITLTAEAEGRLGIETTGVTKRPVQRAHLYGGEIVAAPKRSRGEVGAAYATGGTGSLYQLADARIVADARVEQASAQLRGARLAVERAKRMLANEAGSERSLEEAKTTLAVADAEHRAARARRELLGGAEPLDGSTVWVRTPVFAGDLAELARGEQARVGEFGESDTSQYQAARAANAPASADPTAGTVDLFYELFKSDRQWQPGQRVSVLLPFEGNDEKLIVPWSAVVYDIYGGTWVYERVHEHTFTRRPVQVIVVDRDEAVLKSGPVVGATIVSTGAAELFGTELGVGH